MGKSLKAHYCKPLEGGVYSILLPLQGEVGRGMGVSQYTPGLPHPHPRPPLEGEGDRRNT